jgi:tRNA(His) 5'-end guanylyltransferase
MYHAATGYTQSDEITLIFPALNKEISEKEEKLEETEVKKEKVEEKEEKEETEETEEKEKEEKKEIIRALPFSGRAQKLATLSAGKII